jgi:hypothetical protein
MNTQQNVVSSPIQNHTKSWVSMDDLVRLDQIVRVALDDPRGAAQALAEWFDWNTTHHEGSDVARIFDNWSYDPCHDTLDTMAWYVRVSRDPLPVRLTMTAIIAGALAMMLDDDPPAGP